MLTSNAGAMVIVGAGHCGGRTALELREAGWSGAIELIGEEVHAPYERPPLSKGLLTGESIAAHCALAGEGELDRLGIRRHVGHVVAIDPVGREVTLRTGEAIPYAALLIATGGRVRRLSVPGAEAPQVHTLRNLEDAAALALRLEAGQRLAIIGGGFIGLEVAASAVRRGCTVTVIEMAPRLMGRAVPAPVAERAQALHERHGVSFTFGRGIERFDVADGSVRVMLSDGSAVEADTVVVGVGIEPNLELARAAGLAVGRGILVNAELETSVPGIFAAGDVAEFPAVISGVLMRQETWHNAQTQAHTVARNMLGQHLAYASHAWFWSDQYDHQIQVAGEPALGQAEVKRELDPGGAFILFYLDAGGRLVGACGWGTVGALAKEFKVSRMLVERSAVVDAALLADPASKLKSQLKS